MDVSDTLTELFDRIPPIVRRTVDGLSVAELTRAPGEGANTIAWLVWHLTRIEDDHLAGATGRDQVWHEGGWASRFGLPAGTSDTGWGHDAAQVAAVRPETAAVLLDYHDAVAVRTTELLAGLSPAALDRVVDEGWDPPVTLGVRLVSVAADALQHAGQAAYVRGLLGQ